MSRGLTKKLDYEKGKRNTAAQNPDYRERFQDEGQNYDRGGKQIPKLITFRGKSVTINCRFFYAQDKRAFIRRLKRKFKFVVGGNIGTVNELMQVKALRQTISARFEIVQRSVISAGDIIEVVRHPHNQREFPVLAFRCPFKPAESIPNPIFMEYLAFSMQIVGPALTES